MAKISKKITIGSQKRVVFQSLGLLGKPFAVYPTVRSKQANRQRLFILGFLLVCLPIASGSLSPKNQLNKPVMRLILQTPKVKYKFGEPIEITALLVNTSQSDSYYVGSDPGRFLVFSPFNYIKLVVTDEKGKEMRLDRGVRDPLIVSATSSPRASTVPEILGRSYIQLRPGTIYGITDQIEMQLQPGLYRLTAIYYEEWASSLTEAELKALPIPIWRQPLVSNTVTIKVNR